MAPSPLQLQVPASASALHGAHMNGGEGDASYAKNSTPQRRVQQRLAPLVEAAVADVCRDAASVPRSIGIADLGCSSGPNTLFLVSAAVDAVRRRCAAAGATCPELHVFLNDLPDNDFNAVFRQLPEFLRREQSRRELDAGNVLVFGAPGSFFGRLFPAGSLHLVCSSFSLHWFSLVPRELAHGELVNRGNICAGRTSSPAVIDAYTRQFSRDLTLFLESRAVEVVAGGWVLVSLKRRSARDPCSEGCAMYDHPNSILNDMASRGLLEAAKLDSYNIPAYEPCAEEVRGIVDAEGSFKIVGMESYETAASVGTAAVTACDPAGFARTMRAVHEPMLARHFGAGINMDEFMSTAEGHFGRLINEGTYRGALVHVLSLRRKCKF
ncbi:probable methyltransferase TCM_000168 [Phragmites australis]|uniref:probable methyltransferase TCM_000168 n=1 Tax=Phragmites australis TaxID=29695 RepID=UPI002D782CDB|nr:probable methyltransferase TCM_000168 [Phragmites australis]